MILVFIFGYLHIDNLNYLHANYFKKWYVITFGIGLVFDTTGTLTMERITELGGIEKSATELAIHGITGALAIILMLFHALWATWVLYKNDERKKATFHKFSITVWFIWLIPYLVGMVIGMS
ncbi:HsmA family protein [Clostridium sp. MB40-C1]|uniref:HsmA family protein n=1 Tax=Clostridium sp. MB40-C1 TaxID=3070996 RepID=UPI0027E03777|nr:HsmA family protein [Clostridium sp. MB40-C1]WMJ81687.1 HsmA family protein [Clostridium sp. MB40-C1]